MEAIKTLKNSGFRAGSFCKGTGSTSSPKTPNTLACHYYLPPRLLHVVLSLPGLIFQLFAHEASPPHTWETLSKCQWPSLSAGSCPSFQTWIPLYCFLFKLSFLQTVQLVFPLSVSVPSPMQGPLTSSWNWHQNQEEQERPAENLWRAPVMSSLLFAPLLAAHQVFVSFF